MIILSATMLGVGPGNEDPLSPNGGNPHPVPIIVDGFDFWHAEHEGEMNQAINAEVAADEPV